MYPPSGTACRWDDGRPRSARAKEGLAAYDWLVGMFDGAKHTAAHVRDQVCRFLAMKVSGGGALLVETV